MTTDASRLARRARSRWIVVLAALAAAVAALTACSSSPSSGSSSSGGASSSSTWVLGNIGTYSGPNDADFIPARGTLEAWVSYTNAHGGIQGHQIKLISYDDANQASTALADVQKLIQQDHVLAIVGATSAVGPSWAAYTTQQGIPVVGGATIDSDFGSVSNFFPSGTTIFQDIEAITAYLHSTGKTHGALMYCVENPVCAQSVGFYKSVYQKAGSALVYSAAVSATAANYTAQCLGAKAAGADAVSVEAPTAEIEQIVKQCSAQGYHPVFAINSVGVSPEVASVLGTAGGAAIFNSDGFPYISTHMNAAATALHNALQQYQPSVLSASALTQTVVSSWAAGELFAAAAKAAPFSGNAPTYAEIEKGLYALHGETLGGLIPPVTYAKSKPTIVPCIYVSQLQNGKFVDVGSESLYCPPSS